MECKLYQFLSSKSQYFNSILHRFRWVYCQLQELKKLKSTKPKYVLEALHTLPKTLDEIYTRMLAGIAPMYHKEARTLLQWLAYSQTPPTLAQLAEAAIIDPSAQVSVDIENRGDIQDTLSILSGLVTLIKRRGEDESSDNGRFIDNTISNALDDDDNDLNYDAFYHQGITPNTMIRLAHFSVKEYLESDRIPDKTQYFRLHPSTGHQFFRTKLYNIHSTLHQQQRRVVVRTTSRKIPIT